jgi:energy-coupling factor transport system ATP-binding protein
VPALSSVNWELPESAFTIVAGASGTGKSTLLRCLNGLVPHFSGGKFGGRVLVRGEDTRYLPTRALSRIVGFVFQDPETHSVSSTVEDEIAFGMEQLGVPPATMRRRVEEMLDLLGIERLRHRTISTLSGGERQRVSIAAALGLQPRILALDEPTSQLDPWGAEDVLSAIRRLNEDLGTTIVLAEHRLERVVGFADRMRLLSLAGATVDGSPEFVLQHCDLELCPPVVRLGRLLGWSPLPMTVKSARVRFEQTGPTTEEPAQDSARPDLEPVVHVRKLTLAYGKYTVLHDISFEVRPGEITVLMGRNGTGKSTLLRSLMGLHQPAGGSAMVVHHDVCRIRVDSLGQLVGFLPQRASSLLVHETVAEELAFSAKQRQVPSWQVNEFFNYFDLDRNRNRHPHELSSGEQERVALATALMGGPRVLLLDEPTRGMDYLRKAELAKLLGQLSERGVAVLIATHDVEMAAQIATRVMLLGDGQLIAEGAPREILAGSVTFGTQINKVLSDGYLTVEDVVAPVSNGWENPRLTTETVAVDKMRSGREAR